MPLLTTGPGLRRPLARVDGTLPVSIIIPTLNEASRIAKQVSRCASLQPRPEVIVADGGSGDGTPGLAARHGARVVACARRGRALQMNEGAANARGDVFVFLHADVHLSQPAYAALRETLAEPRVIGGGFRRRFDSASLVLNVGCRLSDVRGLQLHIFLGDQGIFVRREVFQSLGGFPEILLFEDLAFSMRLARQGRTRLILEPVVASSRRFDRDGNFLRLCRNLWLAALYFLGADPDRLARRYYPECFPISVRDSRPVRQGGSGRGGAKVHLSEQP